MTTRYSETEYSIPEPKTVGLELTNYCDAKCIFCPLFQGNDRMDRRVRPKADMPLNLFQKLIKEISTWQHKPQTIFLNMDGEPLLDKLFKQRLSILSQAGLSRSVSVQTNGQFLSIEIAEAIVKNGIGSLVISFDGASKEVYEAHRVGCDYKIVLNNISSFVRVRIA